eukprot:GHVT01038699.1.p2 GENE.GHVT01038699.1~~GHVT01038699.1.p2  ORF type:complete len:116 (-),score=6.28 GHVT01038699.1:233-580(-)
MQAAAATSAGAHIKSRFTAQPNTAVVYSVKIRPPKAAVEGASTHAVSGADTYKGSRRYFNHDTHSQRKTLYLAVLTINRQRFHWGQLQQKGHYQPRRSNQAPYAYMDSALLSNFF